MLFELFDLMVMLFEIFDFLIYCKYLQKFGSS